MTELAIINAKKRRLEEMAESGNERAKKAFELAEKSKRNVLYHPNRHHPRRHFDWFVFRCYLSAPLEDVLVKAFPSIAPYAASISSFLIVAIITYLSLVIGELVPKRLAINSPEAIAVSYPSQFTGFHKH